EQLLRARRPVGAAELEGLVALDHDVASVDRLATELRDALGAGARPAGPAGASLERQDGLLRLLDEQLGDRREDREVDAVELGDFGLDLLRNTHLRFSCVSYRLRWISVSLGRRGADGVRRRRRRARQSSA